MQEAIRGRGRSVLAGWATISVSGLPLLLLGGLIVSRRPQEGADRVWVRLAATAGSLEFTIALSAAGEWTAVKGLLPPSALEPA